MNAPTSHGLKNRTARAENKALAGNVGGNEGEQEVHTPDVILDAARESLGGDIMFDPCAASTPADWFATHNLTVDPRVKDLEAQLRAKPDDKVRVQLKRARRALYLSGPTFTEKWNVGPTFVNMPFEFLKDWLVLLARNAVHCPIVALMPVRTQRTWWMDHMAGRRVVMLKPFPFKGQVQAFPAPLCLVGYGCEIRSVGKLVTGRPVF